MNGKTVSHYPAFRDPVRRDKILEKFRQKDGGHVGEGGLSSLKKNYNKSNPHLEGVLCKAGFEK